MKVERLRCLLNSLLRRSQRADYHHCINNLLLNNSTTKTKAQLQSESLCALADRVDVERCPTSRSKRACSRKQIQNEILPNAESACTHTTHANNCSYSATRLRARNKATVFKLKLKHLWECRSVYHNMITPSWLNI